MNDVGLILNLTKLVFIKAGAMTQISVVLSEKETEETLKLWYLSTKKRKKKKGVRHCVVLKGGEPKVGSMFIMLSERGDSTQIQT
jgi:hypothetical protein